MKLFLAIIIQFFIGVFIQTIVDLIKSKKRGHKHEDICSRFK